VSLGRVALGLAAAGRLFGHGAKAENERKEVNFMEKGAHEKNFLLLGLMKASHVLIAYVDSILGNSFLCSAVRHNHMCTLAHAQIIHRRPFPPSFLPNANEFFPFPKVASFPSVKDLPKPAVVNGLFFSFTKKPLSRFLARRAKIDGRRHFHRAERQSEGRHTCQG